MSDWKQDVLRMRFDEGRTWGYIIEKMQDRLPGKNASQIRDAIRDVARRDPRYKEQRKKEAQADPEYKTSNGWKNGVFESDDLIRMCQEDAKSPRRMLELHGLDPDEWEVVSCRNNLWHGQTHHKFRATEGPRTLLYQSRLTARPIKDGITLSDVERWFNERDFKTDKPPVVPMWHDPEGETLEIDVADLHSGLLAWWRETGEDYDVNIARERFFSAIRDIIGRCEGRKFKKIILALLGDLLHTDNDLQTTAKGTFQQTDGRMSRVFTKTLDMLIEAIDWLGAIAPVDVVYTRGNHDHTMGWALIKAIEQAYRNDPNIFIDVSPDSQKHRMIGCTLVGFVHGSMPEKNLAGWLQVRARQIGNIRYMEVHSGHRHSAKTKERLQTDDAEGVIIRTMPTIATSSTYEHDEGYVSTRSMMCFVWGETAGLREMWFSNM